MTTPYDCIRHRCDFCRRSYAAKSAAAKHEANCWRNPASESCPSCQHFQQSPFVDCAIGLGSYTTPSHPDDDGMFEWVNHCPSWAPRTVSDGR